MNYSKRRFQKLAGILAEQAAAETDLPSPRIRMTEKQRINISLLDAGFGGKRRFRSIGEALNIIDGVLQEYGIEWGEINSADHFRQDSGHKTILLARTNRNDQFSPVEITNSSLGFSWTLLDNGVYEVIAYIG